MSIYRKFLRMGSTPQSGSSYTQTALHIQLLVGMAIADGRLLTAELEEMTSFIDRTRLDAEDKERLHQLLRVLIEAPPEIDQMIAEIAARSMDRSLAQQIVNDLKRLMHADNEVDGRERTLLARLCEALGTAPTAAS